MASRAGEVCAGYGGLALAVEDVFGAETAWVSEYEDAPSRILAHHWPTVPNHGDMTKINWAAVEPVDIVSGGTPCQDLSGAGRRKGMTEGTRSNLWVQMREAIATIRPTYVVWENVRGAYSAEAASDLEHCPGCMGASADRGTVLRALGRVLGDLSDLGYDCQWRGLRAADVGAPHGRFRVFVLATYRDHAGRVEQRRALPVRTKHPASEYTGSHAANTLGEHRGQRRNAAPGEAPGGRAPALDSRRRGASPAADTSGDPGRLSDRDDVPTRSGALGYRAASGRGVIADPRGIGGERRRGYGDVAGASGGCESEGDQREWDGDATDDCGTADSGVAWGEYKPAIRRWEAVLGRRAPAPTELAASYIAMRQRRLAKRDKRPVGMRGSLAPQYRLSARFAEWMMGVPDGWIVDVPGITRNEALKAAGNGVVPQQAIAALRDMLAAQRALEVAA